MLNILYILIVKLDHLSCLSPNFKVSIHIFHLLYYVKLLFGLFLVCHIVIMLQKLCLVFWKHKMWFFLLILLCKNITWREFSIQFLIYLFSTSINTINRLTTLMIDKSKLRIKSSSVSKYVMRIKLML